jgi:hypothetical protein
MWQNVRSNNGEINEIVDPTKFGKFFSSWINIVPKDNSTERFIS